VENASYGLTLCAERVALSQALQEGHGAGAIRALAVVAETPTPVTPCGACRQWLAELAPTAVVYCACVDPNVPTLVTSTAELLPHAFGPGALERLA
jgi:cytidine deaminase